MEITAEMMDYCESQPWDDDLRQDVYVAVLEMEYREINNAFLSRVYTNLVHNRRRDALRRQEIEEEAKDRITHLLGWRGQESSADEVLMASEEFMQSVKGLSPLLRATLNSIAEDGLTPEEVASEEGTTAGTIYKRIHDIRKHLEEIQ